MYIPVSVAGRLFICPAWVAPKHALFWVQPRCFVRVRAITKGRVFLMNRSGIVGVLIIVGIVAFFAFIITMASYTTIDYGTIGLVIRFGKIVNVWEPGLHWKIPFVDRTIVYRTQELVYVTEEQGLGIDQESGTYPDYPTDTTTADGQQISVKYSVRFRIDPEKIRSIANEIGNEAAVVEKVVKFHTRILARNIPKEYEALDLYTGNILQVQEEFVTQLRPVLAEKGVILEAFGLRMIDFQEEYVQAIEQKQIEAENVTTEKNRAEQAKWKAQSAIEAAKGEAAATVENARGEAERIKLIAEAEAEALKLKGDILRQYPEMIQLEFVKSLSDPNSNVSWGIMPQSNVLPFLNVTPESAEIP